MTDIVWRELFNSCAPRYMNEVFTGDSVREVESFVGVPDAAGASVLDAACGMGYRGVELDETAIMVVVRRPPA